jgi:hypothetical protein
MNTNWAHMTPAEKDEYNRLRREKYAQSQELRDRINSQNASWAKANRSSINRRLRSNPDSLRAQSLKKYGITLADYNRRLELQGNKCACCGRSEPGGRGGFAVDHDHATGLIRGLLCNSCNLGIGHLGDSVEGVLNAYNYMRRAYA